MKKKGISKNNSKAHRLLFIVENCVREFIICHGKQHYGQTWYKRTLPGDVLQKFKDGRQSERKSKWVDCYNHDPIYYVDFPDLKTIIVKKDNWELMFKDIFKNETIIASFFEELYPIRNKVAHNRFISSSELSHLEQSVAKLDSFISIDKYIGSLDNYKTDRKINKALEKAIESIQRAIDSLNKDCSNLIDIVAIRDPINEWWFSEDYLHHEISSILEFIKICNEVNSIPRHRGCGHIIENEILHKEVYKKGEEALQKLKEILNDY